MVSPWSRNGLDMVLKRVRNCSEMASKWFCDGFPVIWKMVSKVLRNGFEMVSKWICADLEMVSNCVCIKLSDRIASLILFSSIVNARVPAPDCVYMHTYVCVSAYVRTYIHVCVHRSMHVRISTCVRTYRHMSTNKRAPSRSGSSSGVRSTGARSVIVVVEVVGVVVLQTVVLAAVNRPTHPVSHLVHRHQILSYVRTRNWHN